MKNTVNFGTMGRTPPARGQGGVFRLAIVGDFSGRASRGELKTGDALAATKPLSVSVDNLDDIIKRLKIKLHLPIAADGGAVDVPINSMDDFHPDQLYDNVEVFSGLSGLRQRLKTNSTFAKAALEVQSWLGIAGEASVEPVAKPRSAAVPVNGKLSDFARLVGRASAPTAAAPINELLKRLVGPHVVAAKDPKQDKLLAAVDEAVSGTMRTVLHHPDFQTLESDVAVGRFSRSPLGNR